jgi:hypothetical protein
MRLFQNCWHLKDWIIKDPENNLSETYVENYIKNNCFYLEICADLCNRIKHLDLRPRSIRKDADITKMGTTIKLTGSILLGEPTKKLINDNNHQNTIPMNVSHQYTITLTDGSEYDALFVAKEALNEWDTFFDEENLIIERK